jgi:hypothetical protein
VICLSTLFEDIFKQFYLIIDDRRFIDNLTPDELAVTLSGYLDRSRGMFGDYCYKDLNNFVATQREYYQFVGDGTTNQYTLSPSPPLSCEFYVSINDIETEGYSFNNGTNILTLSATPTSGKNIYVGAFKVGQFTETLNIQEITLLARGMTIPWIEFMLQKKKHLDQIVYGKDMQVHSQANHTQINKETLAQIRKDLLQDMFYYTYKQSDDELEGISGAKYV